MTEPERPQNPEGPDGTDRPTLADTAEVPRVAVDDTAITPPTGETPMRLMYAAISDVGRVRKDNQDSGYAGPWLLTVCDGVGGAARGDIASGTAVSALRALDVEPAPAVIGDVTEVNTLPPSLQERLSRGIHEAHEQIGRIVDADPALNGTSTTSTVALFDGHNLAIGHVGDSRAYLFRDGEISQLTTDHTFVQSLIDEGRITEEEARVHPHRNLILKALDGVHEAEPDLFTVELAPGDRLFLCSDGACGVLDDGRLADILSMGTPDFAAVELVRASLEAGSSDNVTCVVADVLTEAAALEDPTYADLEPMLVGAAAELKRRMPRGLFRGHRSGDTGELPAIDAEIPEGVNFAIPTDPVDAESVRYAPVAPPRFAWLRRLLVFGVLLGLVWIALATAWWYTQRQYYVGEQDGKVTVFRGVDANLPGLSLSEPVLTTDVDVADLKAFDQQRVRDASISADSPAQALAKVEELVSGADQTTEPETEPTEPTAVPSTEATPEPTGPTTGPTDSSPPTTDTTTQSPN